MARRRRLNVFSLSFLDAMTCGFGAVVLFFMVINASVGLRAGRLTHDLQGEVDRLDREVLEGHKNLVELRNSLRQAKNRLASAQGLSRRVLDEIEALEVELATYEDTTLARKEHLNRLKTDLRTLENETRRLAAQTPSDDTPGDRLRSFVGDGDRQYLTGLKVGGRRILILVDASASMLGDTLVNIIRRRNLPPARKIRAEKWQRALATVDWITTQIPRDSHFQIYTFNVTAGPVVPDSAGRWLDGGDRAVLDDAVRRIKQVVPGDGTSLYRAFEAAGSLTPRPDNLILLVDGLPTQGARRPSRGKVSGKERVKLYNAALDVLPRGLPVNVILFPMEGDPLAASAYWKLAVATRGSFLSPPGDWP